MESHNLSSESWHFYLANWGSLRVYKDEPIDICSYIRKVIIGTINMIFATVMIAVIISGLVFCLGAFVYWIYQCIVGMELIYLPLPAAVGAMIVTLYLMAVAQRYYTDWVERREELMLDQEATPKEPGFISLAFQKFKSKSCFMVEFDRK